MVLLFVLLSVNYVEFDNNGVKYFNHIKKSEQMVLKRGRYKIDIYGAQGGYGYCDGIRGEDGGKGAQVSAEFYITSESSKTYYILVGGQGVPNSEDAGTLSGPNKGGYNGGGSGGRDVGCCETTDQNDGPGGGGGATDIRTNLNDYKTRMIVAGGGAGGSWYTGPPGGGLCGMKHDYKNNKYYCSSNTNTIVSGNNKCINTNGVGGNGANDYETPKSGGGGGYCGGFSDNGERPPRPFTSDSGSSYAKECNSNQYENELCFFNVVMYVGTRSGHGMIKLTRIWECEDENCLYCKNASNQCEICRKDFLYYKNGCVAKCPPRTIQIGDHCYECAEGCNVCIGDTMICTSCIDNYYLYHYECLPKCPLTTTIAKDGRSCIDCESPCYLCSENGSTCTYCIAGYFLYGHQCLKECPRGTFTDGIKCSLCSYDCANCTDSADFCLECKENYFFYNNKCYLNCSDLNNETNDEFFGNSYDDFKCHKCLDANCIDCSNNFTICDECSPLFYLNQTTFQCIHVPTNTFSNSIDFTFSNVFSETIQFTFSNDFSRSEYFTFSNVFSESNQFTISSDFSISEYFTFSNSFSYSYIFCFSNIFSESNAFTYSNVFTYSNTFTFSNTFSESNTFSNTNEFTSSLTFSTPYPNHITITITITQTRSITIKKSVSFSISFYLSEIYFLTRINNEFSIVSTKSFFSNYFPFIIRFYSPIYSPTLIIIELPFHKRLTGEMLIAICCGSASVFFFSLAIIIMIYKRLNFLKEMYDYEYSISEDEIKDQKTKENNICLTKSDSDNDLNFWI